MTESDFAWAAGLIDGEGCLFIYNRKNKSYSALLTVTMTHVPTIEKLNSIIPGHFNYKLSKHGHKGMLTWRPYDTKYAIDKIYPYLVCKKAEADILLEFLLMPKDTSHHKYQHLLKRKNELYWLCREAKKFDYTEEIIKRKAENLGKRDTFKADFKCKVCGKEMKIARHRAKKQQYCSPKCRCDRNKHEKK